MNENPSHTLPEDSELNKVKEFAKALETVTESFRAEIPLPLLLEFAYSFFTTLILTSTTYLDGMQMMSTATRTAILSIKESETCSCVICEKNREMKKNVNE